MTPFWKCLKSSAPKPELEVYLHSQGTGSYGAYTTGDIIEGSIHVMSEIDLVLDTLNVTLQGMCVLQANVPVKYIVLTLSVGKSQVETEQVMHYSRSKSNHNFIKISHFMNEANGRLPSCLKAGKEYSFPFLFEVPKRIPPASCQHHKQSLEIFDAHRQLPPTLERTDSNKSDIFTSNVAKISYTIQASLFVPTAQGYPKKPLAVAVQPIRILPSSIEEPLNGGLGSNFYCTHHERNLRTGQLGSSQGKFVAFASSPKPIEIGHSQLDEGKVNTTLNLGIHFYPNGDTRPPQLCSVTTSLCAMTFYSAEPWEDYPESMIGSSSFAHTGRGMYCKSMLLSKRCVKSVPFLRRQSFACKEDPNAIGSHLYNAGFGDQYEAAVLIPITLPGDSDLVPTFHSCLISRVYFLDITLSYLQPRPSLIPCTISLRVPIVVSS